MLKDLFSSNPINVRVLKGPKSAAAMNSYPISHSGVDDAIFLPCSRVVYSHGGQNRAYWSRKHHGRGSRELRSQAAAELRFIIAICNSDRNW